MKQLPHLISKPHLQTSQPTYQPSTQTKIYKTIKPARTAPTTPNPPTTTRSPAESDEPLALAVELEEVELLVELFVLEALVLVKAPDEAVIVERLPVERALAVEALLVPERIITARLEEVDVVTGVLIAGIEVEIADAVVLAIGAPADVGVTIPLMSE